MPNEFVTWTFLATHGGAALMVGILCQFTKEITAIQKVPTQIWSYILSLLVLYPSMLFTGQLTANSAVLILFNAIFVSLAANGGYSVVKRITDNDM